MTLMYFSVRHWRHDALQGSILTTGPQLAKANREKSRTKNRGAQTNSGLIGDSGIINSPGMLSHRVHREYGDRRIGSSFHTRFQAFPLCVLGVLCG